MPKKKKCKKAKWLSEEALQIAEDRRETKGKGKGERKIHALDAEFQRIAKRNKKTFLHEQCREIEWERLTISSIKLEISREHFIQGWMQ